MACKSVSSDNDNGFNAGWWWWWVQELPQHQVFPRRRRCSVMWPRSGMLMTTMMMVMRIMNPRGVEAETGTSGWGMMLVGSLLFSHFSSFLINPAQRQPARDDKADNIGPLLRRVLLLCRVKSICP